MGTLVLPALGVANMVASAGTTTTLYASPTGSGSTCASTAPCSITQAKTNVETLVTAGLSGDVDVQLAGGTYRLSSPLTFTSADSDGSNGYSVTWQAATGASPVISGAQQVTGWTLHDSSQNIWEASVPAGTATRQLYVNGVRAPIAQGTPPAALTFTQPPTGEPYYTAANNTYSTWSNLSQLEFVFVGGNGSWTESRCPVSSVSADLIYMADPCWANATTVQTALNGYFPFRSSGEVVAGAPTRIENNYNLLHVGQWYLDPSSNTLYYEAPNGFDMATADVELPTLQSLVDVAGTSMAPVVNLNFQGITFAYATWTTPSSDVGFDEVQANLTLTTDPNGSGGPEGTCGFTSPSGTCPFGADTQTPSNVTASYALDSSFTDNTFEHLGAGGLTLGDGCQDDTVAGNIFTDISSIGIQIGDADNPNPSSHLDVNSYNTVEDNEVTNVGADFAGAPGIQLWFTQHTSVVHNDIHDVPYDGISSGGVAGHANTPTSGQQTTNDNLGNSISYNVIYDTLESLSDGGAIYVEGSDGPTQYNHVSTAMVDDASSSITYTGSSWTSDSSWPSNYDGTQHTATTNGNSFSYAFTGTSIDYITAEDTNRGQVSVAIDGVPYETADCYAPSLIWQQVCARVVGLASGSHTITVTKLNGTYMTLDALDVTSSDTINEAASYADGLTITGNVAFYKGNASWAYYNDIGSQWITYNGDSEWGSAGGGNGGCDFIGHITFENGYDADALDQSPCGTPTDDTFSGNTTIPESPGTADLPTGVLDQAGIQSSYTSVFNSQSPHVAYSSPDSGTTTASASVLIAGSGFLNGETTVHWGSGTDMVAATSVTVLSPEFIEATAPVGAFLADVSVNTSTTAPGYVVDDSDPSITYTGGWSSATGQISELSGTQHYTETNGDSFTYAFTGTGVSFVTAEDPNRGTVSVAVDGTTVETANCYLPVLAYKRTCVSIQGLSDGTHSITVTKTGGTYLSLDYLVVAAPPLVDLALDATATQSSTYPETEGITPVASLAVDGNTDGNFADGSVSHTNDDEYAWWQADLGSSQTINTINIWNRTDCCGDRLTGYWVFVSVSPLSTSLTPTEDAAVPGVWSVYESAQAGTPTTITVGATGRYIMVRLGGTNYLALAEVQAYGS